jgi:hypothetical protein
MQWCNDQSRPVIFLGSSSNMGRFVDVCQLNGITVAGIMDSDYHGNTDQLDGIPVIASEHELADAEQLDYYRHNFNFFCATTWMPETTAVHQRNREKRQRLIDLMDALELPAVSLIDPWARIASTAEIGRGVFVDCFVIVEAGCRLDDYSTVYGQSGIGHHTRIMRNSVIQRYCSIAGDCVFEPNTFVGTSVKALKTGARFGAGTFIHECVYIRRGTVPNETVSMQGDNMSRVRIL